MASPVGHGFRYQLSHFQPLSSIFSHLFTSFDLFLTSFLHVFTYVKCFPKWLSWSSAALESSLFQLAGCSAARRSGGGA